MNKNILLCGVGGQGTVLASKLIAQSAMNKNIPVMSAETIGMAQKGGSVVSYIRIGDSLQTPMIPKGEADIIIGFEPAETVRMLPFLKQDGYVIVNASPVMPVTATLSSAKYNGTEMIDYLKSNVSGLQIVDCDKATKEIGSAKVSNIVLLGAALQTNILPITKEDIKIALKQRLKPGLLEMNLMALDYVK